jgi:hypothetical protein
MVGRETFSTAVHGLPATRGFVTMLVLFSGGATGCASGAFPGHIGIWVWPGDGCHGGICALKPQSAKTTQEAKSKVFIRTPAYCETAQSNLLDVYEIGSK